MEFDIAQTKTKLKKILTTSRYQHTIGVSYTAVCLAMKYEVDLKKAEIAGLLHDNAKCIDDEKMLKKCRKHGIVINETELKQPYLLHAKLGAFYSRSKYNVEDDEIVNAILYHTIGKPNMTLLEKIVYVADYIEPGRDKAPNLAQIRKAAFEDIDMAVYLILEDTISYLKKEDKKIDTASEKTYEYYKKIIEEREVVEDGKQR